MTYPLLADNNRSQMKFNTPRRNQYVESPGRRPSKRNHFPIPSNNQLMTYPLLADNQSQMKFNTTRRNKQVESPGRRPAKGTTFRFPQITSRWPIRCLRTIEEKRSSIPQGETHVESPGRRPFKKNHFPIPSNNQSKILSLKSQPFTKQLWNYSLQ